MESYQIEKIVAEAEHSEMSVDHIAYIRELCSRYLKHGAREIEEEVEGLLGEGSETFGLEEILNEIKED